MDAKREDLDIASTAGDLTPCSTTASTPTKKSYPSSLWSMSAPLGWDSTPWPGQTFIIRDRTSGSIITLESSKLCVKDGLAKTGGWHWECVETDGWLGFRNSVSGTHIGHDTKGNFWAKVTHHRNHEFFCTQRHPEGGYLFLMRHGDKLLKMSIGGNGRQLVETEKEGTTWEFSRIEV